MRPRGNHVAIRIGRDRAAGAGADEQQRERDPQRGAPGGLHLFVEEDAGGAVEACERPLGVVIDGAVGEDPLRVSFRSSHLDAEITRPST